MTPQIEIRNGVDADGPALARLIAGVFAEYDGCPFVAAEFPELAAPAAHYAGRGGGLWVAHAGATVIGSVALSIGRSRRAELHKLYLAAPFRGNGLAVQLFARAEAHALASGASAIRLWTDTRFKAGHRFYEKLGFIRLPVVRYIADATDGWEYAYQRGIPR
jgi:putative acetyltransferase